jgi:hypothetical protein
MENKVKGGLADGKSINDLVKHHGKESFTPAQFDELEKKIKTQLGKGIKVEMEHTSDNSVAREVAMDHIWEDSEYYDKLKKIEESTKSILRKSLMEDVDLVVTNKSNETTTILVKYNDRNAGIIMVTNANSENTLEIVGVKFKEGYEDLAIISQGVNALWSMFTEINSFIVAPKLESVGFWNKLGFSRISKNYLISNRGH